MSETNSDRYGRSMERQRLIVMDNRGGDQLAVPRPSHDSQRSSSSGRRSGRLCSTCADISFDRYLAEKMRPKSLGRVKDVMRRTYCPFCRLVAYCLGDEIRRDTFLDQPDETVVVWTSLSWVESVEILGWDGLRSTSYSNKSDLKSADKQQRNSSHPRAYRFLVGLSPERGLLSNPFRSDSPTRLGSIQYLADKELEQADRNFFGRKIGQDYTDLQLLRSWIQRCERWHRNRCDIDVYSADAVPRGMRLIDVYTRQVVQAAPSYEFVALSYVWGEPVMFEESGMQMPKLLRRNILVKASGEEYMPLPDRLPRTIKDAMSVTRALGYKYLWNDALCIVQDDDADTKKIHLSAMDAIYSRAALTIAAGSGEHADSGLPGISVPRKYEQYREKVDGLTMACMFHSFSNVEDDPVLFWNTRGWTLQEKLLSKRILLFTDWQIYFKCSEAVWTEESCTETSRLSKSMEARREKYRWAAYRGADDKLSDEPEFISAKIPKSLAPIIDSLAYHFARMDTRDAKANLGFLVNYAAVVERFSERSLTRQEDCFFAIEGVLKTFSSPLYAGLPQSFLTVALLWHCNAGWSSLNNIPENAASWSWVSCCSRDFIDNDQGVAFPAVITWKQNDLINTKPTFWKYEVQGLINIDASLLVHEALSPVSRIEYLKNGRLCTVHVGSNKKQVRRPIEDPIIPDHVIEETWSRPLLRITGYIISLQIKSSIENCASHLHSSQRLASRAGDQLLERAFPHEIVDAKGKCCGEVFTPCSMARRKLSRYGCDFLLLSWGRGLLWAQNLVPTKYVPTERVLAQQGGKPAPTEVPQAQKDWLVGNVLLLAYGDDLAYRVGIGKVLLTTWQVARPRQTTIILG